MSTVAWPTDSPGKINKLSVAVPEQTYRSRYTGSLTSIQRSTGLWTGMTTLLHKHPNDLSVQSFLNSLIGTARTFDVPLNTTTLDPAVSIVSMDEIDSNSNRGINIRDMDSVEPAFPYYPYHVIRHDSPIKGEVLQATPSQFIDASVLSKNIATVSSRTDTFYLSAWVWCDFTAVDSAQLRMGILPFDSDNEPLHTGNYESLNWTGKIGNVYFRDYLLKPGWNEYGFLFSEFNSALVRPPVGTRRIKIYLSFNNYRRVQVPTTQKIQFANFGLWNCPRIAQSYGLSGEYRIVGPLQEKPFMHCRVKTPVGDRLVEVVRTSKDRFRVTPFVVPYDISAGDDPETGWVLRPAWSLRARLKAQTGGVTRTAHWNKEMSFDFIEAM